MGEPLATVQAVFGEVVVVQEEDVMSEGFDVTEEFQLGSLAEVKEDKVLLPTATGVTVRIDKASTRLVRPTEKGNAASGSVRALNLQVRLTEGIPVPDVDAEGMPTGEFHTKYQNKVDFIEVEYQVVKPEARTEERYAGKNRSFLVPLKELLTALGYSLESPPAINDEFLTELVGKMFRVNIGQREIRAFDPDTGKWVPSGDYRNTFRKFTAA